MSKISVAFIDDQPIFLASIAGIFAQSPDVQVTATGTSVEDAVRIAAGGGVDVIVIDTSMPGNVFGAIKNIAGETATRVVVFTSAVGIDYAVQALEAGASGYVTKRSAATELHHAIRTVSSGELFITPTFASKVISALRNTSVRKQVAAAIKLSIREEQIVRLLVRGRTNKEIAKHLSISEKTVKYYMGCLMQKLNARNRTEVALVAQNMSPSNGLWN